VRAILILFAACSHVADTRPDASSASIAAWGDSLTAGAGVWPYPDQLSALLGRAVYNGGSGGNTSTQIAARMIADTKHDGWIAIIWAGRNNYWNREIVERDIASMVAIRPDYLVIGVINGDGGIAEYAGSVGYDQIVTLNRELAMIYGDRYLDIRTELVSRWDPSLPGDVIDHDRDIPPRSLRVDEIHLNSAGYGHVAARVGESLR